MISFFLRHFEDAVDQLLHRSAHLDGATRAYVQTLQQLGALVAAPPARVVRCPECNCSEVVAEYDDVGCYGLCADCGKVRFGKDWLDTVRLQPAWLFDVLRQQIPGLTRGSAKIVVPDLLWQLGTLDLSPRMAAVLIARLPRDGSGERQIVQGIISSYSVRPHIVLCSRPSVLEAIAIPTVRAVIPLEDVLHDFGHRLQLDADCIRRSLEGEPCGMAAGPVSVAEDGSWLRIGGRELRLRGKQRDFALVMVKAYRQSTPRPKREWALRAAGYDGTITDLRQITTRPEFHTFFGSGNGEVWLRVEEDDA